MLSTLKGFSPIVGLLLLLPDYALSQELDSADSVNSSLNSIPENLSEVGSLLPPGRDPFSPRLPPQSDGRDTSAMPEAPSLLSDTSDIEELDDDIPPVPLFSIGNIPFHIIDLDDKQIEHIEKNDFENSKLSDWLQNVRNENDSDCRKLGLKVQALASAECANGECILSGNIPAALTQAVDEYDEGCAASLDGFEQQVASTVVIIFQNTLACLGWMDEFELITAKHCFLTGTTIHPYIEKLKWRKIRFEIVRLTEPEEIMQIEAVLPRKGAVTTDDVIVFSFNTQEPASHFPAKKFERAAIISANQYLPSGTQDLSEIVRRYDKPSCGIIEKIGGCVVHSCPTLATFSGAPIYQEVDGKLHVVAIHSGFNKPLTPDCKNLDQFYTRFNLATQIIDRNRLYKAIDTMQFLKEEEI